LNRHVSIPSLLRELLTTPGPSGYEAAAAAKWRAAAEPFAEVWTDTMGSSYAKVAGTDGGPSLAIFGHIDEIGIAITHVDDQGNLAFSVIGGYEPSTLVAQRVELITRNGTLQGVIARRRLSTGERKEGKKPELSDLHVDIGARDRDDALALVELGDPGVLGGAPEELPNGRFVSRSLDNRLGSFIALEAARHVADGGGAPGDVIAVASVQEEVGVYGARAAAYALEPQVALAVDITPSTDVPGGDVKIGGKVEVGSGPAVARGSTLHPRVVQLLLEAAEAESIDHSVEVTTAHTYTDADYVHLSRSGVPTGLVSIPIRYAHTSIELAQWSDVEGAVKLIAAFAQRLSAESDFTR
jgi:putative aminopeptidase FrvX